MFQNKNKKSIFLVLLSLLFIITFSSTSFASFLKVKSSDDIRYLKDKRTELCFAYYKEKPFGYHGYFGLANVPCEKVEKYLDNGE